MLLAALGCSSLLGYSWVLLAVLDFSFFLVSLASCSIQDLLVSLAFGLVLYLLVNLLWLSQIVCATKSFIRLPAAFPLLPDAFRLDKCKSMHLFTGSVGPACLFVS